MKRKFITILAILIISLVLFSGCGRRNRLPDNDNGVIPSNGIKPGDYRFTIIHDNVERFYLLHVPASYNENPTPLIVAFHGGMGDAETMSKYYGLTEKSDKEGFIIAFPNGVSRFSSGKIATWNAGNCCGYAVESKSDDVGFTKAMIEDIKSKANIGKVFATGISNGGMMSYRLACEIPDTFTAIAAVSGTDNYDECNPKKPISIMHIHGLLDDHVLFEGGCGPECNIKSETAFTSVPDTISLWVERDNCAKTPTKVLEKENAYCELYTGCDNNTQVKLCVVEDGSHSWPGTPKAPNPLETTTPSQAISATDEIWDFFKTLT